MKQNARFRASITQAKTTATLTPAQEALEPVIIVEDTENDGNTNF